MGKRHFDRTPDKGRVVKMKKILSIVILLVLSSSAYADNQRAQEIIKKCSGLNHWLMIRCVELENQGKEGRPLPTRMTEQYRSLADLAKEINPIPPTKKSIEQGKTVFYQYCYSCHGMEGKDNGPATEYLGRPAADLTGADVRKENDGVLFWKITEGNIPRPMPAFRAFLTKEDVWNMINYIRTLSPKEKQKG